MGTDRQSRLGRYAGLVATLAILGSLGGCVIERPRVDVSPTVGTQLELWSKREYDNEELRAEHRRTIIERGPLPEADYYGW